MAILDEYNPMLTYLPLNGTLAGKDSSGSNFSAVGSGALRWQPAENARVTYCINSRFANNTDGWATNGGSGASITRIADSRFAGGFACRVVAPNDTSYRGLLQSAASVPLNIPAYSITQITISFDIIVESGPLTGLRTGINIYSANNAYVSSSGSAGFSVSAFDTIERKSVTVTPNTANFYKGDKFVVYVANGQLSTSQFLISNIVVEFGDVPNATYFDGAMPGCSFLDPRTGQLGSAHASPSCNQVAAWIEEGTTNLCRNPSFETNVSLWGYIQADLARDTVTAFSGSASMEVTRNTAAGYFSCYYTTEAASVAPGDVLTISARVKGTVSLPNFAIDGNWKDSSSANVGSALLSTAVTIPTGEWTYIIFTTPAAPALTDRVTIAFTQRQSGTIGDAFFIDCVQIEKKAYATSYCDGSLGTGYSWSGTAHASASTRTGATISFEQAGRISSLSGALAFRYTRKIDTGAEETILTCGTVGAATDYLELGIDASDHVDMEWNSNGAGARRGTGTDAIAVDTEYFLYADWTGTAIRLSVDNGTLAIDTRDAVQGSWGAGDLTLSAATGSVVYNGFATFDRVLTTYETTRLYVAPAWSLSTLAVNAARRIRSQFQLRPY